MKKTDIQFTAQQGPEAESLSSQPESSNRPRKGTARLRAESDVNPSRRNITLQLEPDGAPKWEGVTEKNRESWRGIVVHPSTVQALGLTPSASAEPAATLPPAAPIGAALDALAWAEAYACSKLMKVSFEEAVKVLAFTNDEKALLIPPAQAVAGKYLGAALDKYGDEAALSLLLVTVTLRKVEALKALPRESGPPSSLGMTDSEIEARVQ